MGLRTLPIKNEYRSLIDKVAQDFYIPLLNEAVSYKRAVGFFSSSALVEISKGISGLVKNGGTIQLVASPYLSNEDIQAIEKGYEMREQIIERALIRDLHNEDDPIRLGRLNLLANLIADGVLDIRIAFTVDEKGIGMYHEKMGIIEDSNGDKVAFAGSMNESATAMALNYEAIDVFCEWDNDKEKDRVAAKVNAFHAIWNDCEPNIKVVEFPDLKKEIIDRYKRTPPNLLIDYEEFGERITNDTGPVFGARVPSEINLYPYQLEAINAWEENGFCGVFDMATGTGKTLTGLGAISKLSTQLRDNLAVVIVCPYQHLVEQWVEDIVKFNIQPIIGYSSSSQKDWKKRLSKAIRDQKLKVRGKSFFTFICTNATFSSDAVQEQLKKIKSEILLVVDEAHNFGATRLGALLDQKYKYRLALSATLERHRDDVGTQLLMQFFGKKCIEYNLERAIEEDKLTPYKYYPIIVYLTNDELDKYNELSYEMSKQLTTGKNGEVKLNKYGEILALQRARIVAAASEKLCALEETIRPYINNSFILVYCGAANVLDYTKDISSIDASDIRQIEAVTDILGNRLDMRVSQFTSNENIEQRATIKKQFQNGQGLQALIAIKCLDEGVNIPSIRTAFILASTTNPKEYIQRRGRVLRKAPGKEYAEIFDYVTLPRQLDSVSSLTLEQMKRDYSLVKNELSRIEEFGRLAMNAMVASEIVWKIREAYHLEEWDELNDIGVELNDND